MLSYQLFAENVLFLPLHWRNKGAIWSWLKLLTDNKNIFTSSPPIVPSCGFSQSLFPPLIAKTIKTKQHKFVSSTLKIFKSQHIKRHLWLEVCKWVSGETFYLLTRGSCCKTRTFISTLFAKVAFKKPPSCAFHILWLFHQWCQDMLHYICTFYTYLLSNRYNIGCWDLTDEDTNSILIDALLVQNMPLASPISFKCFP